MSFSFPLTKYSKKALTGRRVPPKIQVEAGFLPLMAAMCSSILIHPDLSVSTIKNCPRSDNTLSKDVEIENN